jgi:hypothetical protein
MEKLKKIEYIATKLHNNSIKNQKFVDNLIAEYIGIKFSNGNHIYL